MAKLSTQSSQAESFKLKSCFGLHKLKADLVKTDIFVCLEDDNTPPENCITVLLNLLDHNSDAAIATAVNCYRCPQIHKMGVGVAQEVIMDQEKIIKKVCCRPDLKGVHDVVACGFNCFACRTQPYRDAFKKIEDDKLFPTYIGNDMLITYLIHKAGWRILADFDYWCQHMQTTPKGIYFYEKKDAIQDVYTWNENQKRYKYLKL